VPPAIGAPSDVRIKQRDRLFQGCGLGQLETASWGRTAVLRKRRGQPRGQNLLLQLARLQRSNGWPRLPSFPVNAASTA